MCNIFPNSFWINTYEPWGLNPPVILVGAYLNKPRKWFNKGSTFTVRFQAPVTTDEPETLLDSQAKYICECRGPVWFYTGRHGTTVVLVPQWCTRLGRAPFFLVFLRQHACFS